jgi:ABC-type multidrug transport system ATPase subunit
MNRLQVYAYVEEYWNSTFILDEIRSGRKKVKYLSRGQKMQCAICRAFLSWPTVYFLDEPTVALDVDAIDHFYSLVQQASKRGSTLLISSHQLSAIEDLCDSVGILQNKSVTIVKSGAEALLPKSWMIRCDGDQRFGTTIEGICGFPAVFRDNAWHFAVAEAETETVVPAIVTELVSSGCHILEVGAETDSLKDRIRNSRS